MKTNNWFSLLLLVWVFSSCKDENSYLLKGNINGLQNQELYVVTGAEPRIDTVHAKNGKFTYRGVSQTVEPLVIYMKNGSVWVTMWVENGETFTLTGEVDYPEMILVKGGEINQLLTDFKKENLSLIKERCELRDKLLAHSESSQESIISINDLQLSSQIKNIDQMLKNQAQDFVEAYPSSIASLVMIQDYILDIENASAIQPSLNRIEGEAKTNKMYDKLQALCRREEQTKIGQPALDFNITDTKGDTICLKTFKNKYLLLTFATSQCEFCEPEYSELHTIKKNFPAKELAILTVSLDENPADWQNLAEEQKINWQQAVDSAGWASEMASNYNVLSIPCNYLIDKEGIIIGSKLPVDSIQTILEERMGNK